MKNISKTNDELENWSLIKFKELPNLDENKNITSDDCYNPTLYKYDGHWILNWVNYREGNSVLLFAEDSIYAVIRKAYEYFTNKSKMFYSK